MTNRRTENWSNWDATSNTPVEQEEVRLDRAGWKIPLKGVESDKMLFETIVTLNYALGNITADSEIISADSTAITADSDSTI